MELLLSLAKVGESRLVPPTGAAHRRRIKLFLWTDRLFYTTRVDRRYSEWCDGEGLSATELGRELRAIIDALGLECKEAGRDVIVYGAAISE